MTATAKENVTESPRKSSRIVKSKRVVATRNDAAVEEPNETSPQPPQENDVLLYSQADWPGNSFFYKLLERRKDEFQRLERSKRTIAEEVVTLVVENNGRFFTPQGNSWTCVEDTETLVNEIISALEANSPAPMPNTTYKHSLYSSSSPYNMTVVQPTQPTYYVSPTPVPTERATLLEKKKLKPSPSPAKKHTVVKHKFQEDVSSYSQKAAFKMALNKEMALPKGVTMRPSGKWASILYCWWIYYLCQAVSSQSITFVASANLLCGTESILGGLSQQQNGCHCFPSRQHLSQTLQDHEKVR